MEKAIILKIVITLLQQLLKDTDGDGRPDLFDSSPQDSEVK